MVRSPDSVSATAEDENGGPVAGTCSIGVPGDMSHPTVCSFGSLYPSKAGVMTIVVTVPPSTPPGVIFNDAAVFSDQLDPNNLNNVASEATGVIAVADLWLDKTGSFRRGRYWNRVHYTLVAHNDMGCSVDSPVVCGRGGRRMRETW